MHTLIRSRQNLKNDARQFTARLIRDMQVSTYLTLWAQRSKHKASQERNEADKARAMTFRRGRVERPAQVTAALSATTVKKGRWEPRDIIGREQPRSLAPRGGGVREDFGLNVA
jgi:hypothetical protein